MLFLRQLATHKVVLGPFVSVSDGFTPVTGVSLQTGGDPADAAEAIRHDSGETVDISAYTWAGIANADGYYHLTLQAGAVGIGHLTIVITNDSLHLPVKAEFTVVEEAVYDVLFASLAVGPALASVATEARLAELDAANLPTDVAAIPTTAMRGTDSAALASVCTEARLAVLTALTAAAAAKLALSSNTIVSGTVDTATNSHTPTTSEFQADDITEATADHYVGRIVIFTSGALANQATDILDYEAVGGIGQLTVTPLTEAPANDVTFIIV